MCCRFYMEEGPELSPYVDAVNQSALTASVARQLGKHVITSGEVRPTDIAAALASGRDGAPRIYPMIWGFSSRTDNRPLINCRVETAGEKSMWKEAWRYHRCVIPAAAYFEWEHPAKEKRDSETPRKKYMIRPRNGSLTYLAGLYRIEEHNGILLPAFAVLTRVPAESIRFIHDRMPLILPGEVIRQWINPNQEPEALLEYAVTDLSFYPAASSG